MATKKQKRTALEARRQEREAQRREDGLRAQQRDREMRAARMEQIEFETERRKRRDQTRKATAHLLGKR